MLVMQLIVVASTEGGRKRATWHKAEHEGGRQEGEGWWEGGDDGGLSDRLIRSVGRGVLL